MSELTLDEAIKHCLEVAEQNERKAEYRPRMDYYDEIESRADCLECAADHRQLAEWLTELKELRGLVAASNVLAKDVLAVDTLCKQILEYKRLLKLAVEDMHIEDMCDACVKRIPDSPIRCPDDSNCFVWRYKDEALKLIEGNLVNDDERVDNLYKEAEEISNNAGDTKEEG